MELKNVYRGRIKEYVDKYPTAKYVGDGAKPWFEKGAQIALPCATQNELNEEAAKALVANGVIAVAEGANMPSTPGAIRVFQEAKILYSPGKASNAGGVSVSGLEMSQNSERLSWTSEGCLRTQSVCLGLLRKLTLSSSGSWRTSTRTA